MPRRLVPRLRGYARSGHYGRLPHGALHETHQNGQGNRNDAAASMVASALAAEAASLATDEYRTRVRGRCQGEFRDVATRARGGEKCYALPTNRCRSGEPTALEF